MGYTPLATRIDGTTDRSSRDGAKPRMVILHHGATTSLDQIVKLMQPGGRTVSAHAAVKDNQIVGTVEEQYRAWSLSDAQFDSISFTVECANESVEGWTISASSHESLARLTADWAKRYNFPIIRTGDKKSWTLLGHREVYEIWGGSYPTACPGGMNLNWIAARANQILNPKKTGQREMFRAALNGTNKVAYFSDISWKETTNGSTYDDAWGRFVGKPGLTVSQTEWDTYKNAVTENRNAIPASGSFTSADRAALLDLPTNGEMGQALTSTVALVNEHADDNRDAIIAAIPSGSGGGGSGSYSLSLDIDNVPGTATGTATPA